MNSGHISVYNKVGYAYGTLTDCAYIRDDNKNIEMIISATILVNKDQIFNDDNYEYEEIGIPFLAELGRELYKLEKKRIPLDSRSWHMVDRSIYTQVNPLYYTLLPNKIFVLVKVPMHNLYRTH